MDDAEAALKREQMMSLMLGLPAVNSCVALCKRYYFHAKYSNYRKLQ